VQSEITNYYAMRSDHQILIMQKREMHYALYNSGRRSDEIRFCMAPAFFIAKLFFVLEILSLIHCLINAFEQLGYEF